MKWLVACLIAAMLAGCSDADVPTSTTDEEVFDEFEAKATATTGVIRGVVVDNAIVPVQGAKVMLRSTGEEVFTNSGGAFAFSEVEPGTYFMEASKIGFIGAQSSTEVEAGVDNPPVVKILLEHDPAGFPYYNEYQFNGRIVCGTNNVALCGGVNDFTGQGGDTYSQLYDTENNITHLQTEMIWENTQSFGDAFTVQHRYATKENHDGGFYDGSLTGGSGPSPLMIVTNATRYNDNNVGEDYEFLTSIFAGASEAIPVFGMAVEQDYQMFIHEFHLYTPPVGWQFSTDPSVPAPQ